MAVISLALAPTIGAAYESGRAAFTLVVNDELAIPYRVFAVYVLPGESLTLRAPAAEVTAQSGRLTSSGRSNWQWVAPNDPGITNVVLTAGRDSIRLNVFILNPASRVENGRLNGYTIGDYPAPLRGDPVYSAPDGYIELTAATANVELSPHFRLSHFPSKQAGGFPKYLVLREDLFLKLELLLEHVNASGTAAETFTIMSGFRTPVYNRAIGNGQHSRHIYGGAADIYIDDSPADGIMDDLNGDGILNFRDAQFLYRLADEYFGRPENAHLRGGLGVYRSTSAHGPFLHIDARRVRARWGLIP